MIMAVYFWKSFTTRFPRKTDPRPLLPARGQTTHTNTIHIHRARLRVERGVFIHFLPGRVGFNSLTMTNTIKFSFPFSKLFINSALIDSARLLQVLQIDLSDITQELRDYDTDFGAYPLPVKGKYLMLLFMKPNGGGLMTTLRRETPSKLEYYRGLVGEWVAVNVSHDVKTEEI